MQDFRNLEVWRKAHTLALDIYRLTESFPRSEMFGLCSQMRRSASSIPTNLAEGCGRTQPEFGRFVQIGLGSACELEYQLLLARDLGFLAPESYEGANAHVVETKRMLSSLIKRIQGGIAVGAASKGVRDGLRKAMGHSILADG
ncbi:MAG: four helix bundle protein [Candidatus Korobacteraceae bacterium]